MASSIHQFLGNSIQAVWGLLLLLLPLPSLEAQCFNWQTRAPLPTGTGFSSAFASQGDLVYNAGGTDLNFVSNSLFRRFSYSSSFLWANLAPLTSPRCAVSMAVSPSGKVYVFGGVTSMIYGPVLSLVEEYDPSTNSWTTKAPMPTARYGTEAVYVGGKIFVLGGFDSQGLPTNLMEAYDPLTNSWATMASMPAASWDFGLTAMTYQGCSPGQKIYISGGIVNGNSSSQFARYDLQSNTWTSLTPLPFAVRGHTMVEGVMGAIYIAGGYRLFTGVSNQINGAGCSNNYSTWAFADYLCRPTTDHCFVSYMPTPYDQIWGVIGGSGTNGGLGTFTFSEWKMPFSIMPTELLHLDAGHQGAVITLDWFTSNTTPANYFLERSPDGLAFAPLDLTISRITDDHYQAFDPNPNTGWNHYRIGTRGIDGQVFFSNTVKIESHQSSLQATIMYLPEPKHLRILYRSPAESSVASLSIFSANGTCVAQHEIYDSQGELRLDLSAVSSGVYFLRLSSGSELSTQPIVLR